MAKDKFMDQFRAQLAQVITPEARARMADLQQSERTLERTPELTVELTDERTPEPTPDRTLERTPDYSLEYPNEHSTERTLVSPQDSERTLEPTPRRTPERTLNRELILSQREVKILTYLINEGGLVRPVIVSATHLADHLAIPYSSIRRNLDVLATAGFIEKSRYQKRSFTGIAARVIREYDPGKNGIIERTPERTLERTDERTVAHTGVRSSSRLDRDKEKTESIPLMASEVEEKWPELAEIGFGSQELNRVIVARRENEVPPDTLNADLDIVCHWVRSKDWLEGKSKPVGYIVRSLSNGECTPLPGYRTPAERRLDAQRALLERNRKAKEEERETAVQSWLLALSKGERDKILAGKKVGPDEQWLRSYFLANVWEG